MCGIISYNRPVVHQLRSLPRIIDLPKKTTPIYRGTCSLKLHTDQQYHLTFCFTFCCSWTNPSNDILVCVHCNAALAIKFHSSLKPADKWKITKEFRSRLCSGHIITCLFHSSRFPPMDGPMPAWAVSIIPEYLMEIMDSPTLGLPAIFEKRTMEFKVTAQKNVIFPLDLSFLEVGQNIIEDVHHMLGKFPYTFLALVIFGWESISSSNDSKFILQCGLCLAQSEIFCSNDNNQEHSEIDQPTQKRQKISNAMNPLTAHRHYCPMKCGFPKDASSAVPLWQTIANKLLEDSPQLDLELDLGLRSLQQMLSSSISDRMTNRDESVISSDSLICDDMLHCCRTR